MKPTEEVRRYWREGRTRRYRIAHPETQARKEVLVFLTKKQTLTEGRETNEALEQTLDKIRALLTGESVDVIETKRRAGV